MLVALFIAGMGAGAAPEGHAQSVGDVLRGLQEAARAPGGVGVRHPAHRPALGATRGAVGTYQVTYRPSDAEYVVEEREHFDLIYQRGYHGAARSLGNVLEATRAGTDSLIHGRVQSIHMPVVVDGFSDRSNGFVTPLPFKQEIEAPALKSDELLPRSQSWPALVGTHELVHAAQAEVDADFGVGTVVRFFAPDVARSINLAAPRGLTEGAAVYRESTAGQPLGQRAGRLNESLFRMKMRAAMLSEDPWELTQMMEPPGFTQPFNRFYVGGAYAFRSLADAYGTHSLRHLARNFNRLPFLGYGPLMWWETGETPAQIGNDLRESMQRTFEEEVDALGTLTEPALVSGRTGLNHRRPYWIGDDTLVAYVHGYATRPGFYRIDAETGAREPIRVQRITEDYTYSLSPDTTALLASRYVADPLVPTQALAEAERVDLASGKARRLTDGGRVLAPVEVEGEGGGSQVWAIQNDGPQTQWAVVEEDGSARALTGFQNSRFRQIAPSPSGDRIAVLLNVEGRQQIYRVRRSDAASGEGLTRPERWLGLEDAVIYDVSWGPEGRYLLFGADLGGIPNAYAFDTRTETVRRLTNVPYGAFEPALSPDRSTLAFVRYQHERRDLVTLPFAPREAPAVADSLVQTSPKAAPRLRMDAPAGPTASEIPRRRDYQAWRHLIPRVAYPVIRASDEGLDGQADRALVDDLGVGLGVGVSGADPLQRWTYDAEAYWQDGRPWGAMRVQTGRFLLRPSVFAYNEPDEVPLPSAVSQFKFEERGVGAGVELPVTLQQNVFLSLLRLRVDGEFRQTRYYGDAAETFNERSGGTPFPTAFRDRATVTPRLVLGYRLQQNTRDLVPNTGVVWRTVSEVDAWTDGVRSSRALASDLSVYLPFLRRWHTGFELGAGVLTRTEDAIFDVDPYLPRGYDEIVGLRETAGGGGRLVRAGGTFLRFDAEVTQPVLFVDDGLFLVPIYLKALSLYGFGQTLGAVDRPADAREDPPVWDRLQTSVGGGVGLRLRLFHQLDLTLRVGAAYRVEAGDVEVVFR